MNFIGCVDFVFRDTKPKELDATMHSLGASPKSKPIPWPGWLYPSSENPLLDLDLIADVRNYAMDLVWESWQWFIPLLTALRVEDENAVIVRVGVRDDPTALNILHILTLMLLENHPGVVRDTITEEVWTREEIETNSVKNARTFFGQKRNI